MKYQFTLSNAIGAFSIIIFFLILAVGKPEHSSAIGSGLGYAVGLLFFGAVGLFFLVLDLVVQYIKYVGEKDSRKKEQIQKVILGIIIFSVFISFIVSILQNHFS